MMTTGKKSILFVNESLACAGGEKSLLNLLGSLDYEKYDVDLQLFKYGCPWDKYIDPRVNVLPPSPYTKFTEKPLIRAIGYAIVHGKFKWLISRLKYSKCLRRKVCNLNNIAKSCLYWQTQGGCFEKITKKYDYVIGYAQGIPTFYVADKAPVKSRKLAWINATYEPAQEYLPYIDGKYSKINVVNAVSEVIKDIESECFPRIKSKLVVFRDPINPSLIQHLSKENIDLKKCNDQLTIVTLGRLCASKGYDITIEAAKVLMMKDINFVWYILGVGPLAEELKQAVSNANLSRHIIFLGVKENPYPYLKIADIYVQTSRYEGFGLAIAEARLLNIPVVTTRFNTVFMQMIDRKNGLVTDMNGESVAKAIIELYSNKKLYASIKDYLIHESKGNLEIIPQFYEILDYKHEADNREAE